MRHFLFLKLIGLFFFLPLTSAQAITPGSCVSLFTSDAAPLSKESELQKLREKLNIERPQRDQNGYFISARHFSATGEPLLQLITAFGPAKGTAFFAEAGDTQRFYWVTDLTRPDFPPVELKGDFGNYGANSFSKDGSEVQIVDFLGRRTERLTYTNRIFSTKTGALLRELPPPYGAETTLVKISNDFKTRLIRNKDGSFSVMSVLEVSQKVQKNLATFQAQRVLMTPDGRFVIAKQESTQKIYRVEPYGLKQVLETRRSVGQYQERIGQTQEVFSEDGRYVFVKDALTSGAVFSLETGKEVSRISMIRNYHVAIAPNNKYVLLVRNNKVFAMELQTGQQLADFTLKGDGTLTTALPRQTGVVFAYDSNLVGLKMESNSPRLLMERFVLDMEKGEILSGYDLKF